VASFELNGGGGDDGSTPSFLFSEEDEALLKVWAVHVSATVDQLRSLKVCAEDLEDASRELSGRKELLQTTNRSLDEAR